MILLTLSRAWVCPPRPYTCHTFYVSHQLLGTINIKTKIHHGSNEEALLLHESLQSLHYPHDPMMSVIHMMSSCPHTSGGNLLMQKIHHLSLYGLNHIHTSFPYHFSLPMTFTTMVYLHSLSKKAKKSHKRA